MMGAGRKMWRGRLGSIGGLGQGGALLTASKEVYSAVDAPPGLSLPHTLRSTQRVDGKTVPFLRDQT
jgi:hypothetical protein